MGPLVMYSNRFKRNRNDLKNLQFKKKGIGIESEKSMQIS